jgi:hypothetical protein
MLFALAGIAFVLLLSIRKHEERASRRISSVASVPPLLSRDPPRAPQA